MTAAAIREPADMPKGRRLESLHNDLVSHDPERVDRACRLWKRDGDYYRSLLADADYVQLLDSLARFHGSEITVHVGYFLTMTAFVVGSSITIFLTVFLRPDELLLFFLPSFPDLALRSLVFLLLALSGFVYFFSDYTYCFRYLYGRTLLYSNLLEITWEHMGLTDRLAWKSVDFTRLKSRALRLGIREAVTSLFEAYLFVGKHQDKEFSDKLTEDNLKAFDAYGYYDAERTYYNQPTFFDRRGWKVIDLLLIAYRGTILSYPQGSPKRKLLRELIDC